MVISPSSSTGRPSIVKSASAYSRLMPSFSVRSLRSALRPFSRFPYSRARSERQQYVCQLLLTRLNDGCFTFNIENDGFANGFPSFSPSSRSNPDRQDDRLKEAAWPSRRIHFQHWQFQCQVVSTARHDVLVSAICKFS